MAYHDAVRYIEDMKPAYVNAVGEECLRTKGIIRSALPTLSGLPGTVTWQSDAADRYEQRLKETIDLVEGLHDGFDKAGQAVCDYARAQGQAQALVATGAAAEGQLHALIAPIVATQSFQVRFSDALRQWNDLRSVTGVTDWIAEYAEQDEINKVRAEAERLWHSATGAYDDAIRIESTARGDAVARLTAAYRLLPDFLAPHLAFDDDFPYDPDASPTMGDYASWEKWNAKLHGAQVVRPDLDDATATYAHYLDATGTDMRIDYDEAYKEDTNIRRAVDNEILTARQEAERIFRETGQTGFEMTGDPALETELAGGYPSTENWQKTLGDHTIYGTAQVVVTGNQVTMKIKVHAEDMYNFNLDAQDVATGASDNENGRFSTLGWAKGFRTHGELERTVTWTVGDTPAVSSGTGPERHAPGEDRADGRGSG
ncbi:MAG: hypothetical protein AUG44_28265 [Actinobacteria bacterium 13_1_20CM_3_71_11]|nr:MAG: hypothetical protein AUG44_28265 [Actinobacteria bacterium 13_1_20CM_3_71_11]